MDNKIDLLRELQKENKWWTTGTVDPNLLREFKRADFFVYKEQLISQDYPTVIIGPRRVGKSTTLYQLIDDFIKIKQIPPQRILLLSLERSFFDVIQNPIKSSLDIFEENILKESISDLKKPIYVFLDEASRREGWAIEIKEYVDRKYNIKFYITGSSSPALFQKSTESLVGRHEKRIMLTLKFRDMLKLKNRPELNHLMHFVGKQDLRNAFTTSIKNNTPEIFANVIRDAYVAHGPEGELMMQIQLNDYLLRGGYPEFYDKKTDWNQTSKILREAYFESIISFDVMRTFGSRNPDKLKKLYTYLAFSTAQITNFTNLCKQLDLARGTLDEYVYQLQETYLIRTSSVYKKKQHKASNDIKKVYVGDVGFRNAILGVTDEEMKDPTSVGNLAETIAQDHTLRLKFCFNPSEPCDLYFWKDKQNREVDIVGEFFKSMIPIEVKYQESIRGKDISALKNAIQDLDSPFGILITKKSFQYKDDILSIPLWLYLLMC